jgi:hypothetical protein
MISRIVSIGVVLGASILAVGCSPKKPPDPTPQPSASVVAKPDPPKPKLCESLSEDCVADGDKNRAKIASSNFVFIPPKGWTYATESGQTIARRKGEPLAMAMTGIELPKAAADQAKTLDVLFPKLIEAVGVTLEQVNKKPWSPPWKAPNDKPKIGANQFEIWENTGSKLGDKGGNLLTFTTKDAGGKTILGVAFYPAENEPMALINHTMETIGPGEP